jgi:hypothetical protein
MIEHIEVHTDTDEDGCRGDGQPNCRAQGARGIQFGTPMAIAYDVR